jgi:hypothetical protein
LTRESSSGTLEVEVLPHKWSDGRKEEPILQLAIEPPFQFTAGYIYLDFDLVLTNHRTDRKERIIKARLALKEKRFKFWRRTVIEFPVRQQVYITGPTEASLENIELEPLSAPREVYVHMSANIEKDACKAMPRFIEAWLVLDLVGPVRHLKKRIHSWIRQRAGSTQAI